MPETTPQPTAAPTKSKKSLMFLVVGATAIVALAGGGFAAYHFMPHQAEAAPKSAKKESKRQIKSVMHLESFVVNLTGPEESGYVRVGIDLGLATAAASAGEGEKDKGSGNTAIVRDSILTVLGKAKAADLLTPEGKEQLKKDIVTSLDERVPDLEVHEVYFTEFIVQR